MDAHPPSTVVRATTLSVDGQDFLVVEMSNLTTLVYRGSTIIAANREHFMSPTRRKVLAAYHARRGTP